MNAPSSKWCDAGNFVRKNGDTGVFFASPVPRMHSVYFAETLCKTRRESLIVPCLREKPSLAARIGVLMLVAILP